MRRNKGRILQVILFLIFVISSGVLMYDLVIAPKQNQEMTKKLKEEFPEKDTQSPGVSPAEEPAPEGEKQPAGKERVVQPIDLAALQGVYPDVKGWITIPDTNIDYPVLQSEETEPEYYLKHNYRGEWDANGSLFLQWNCEVSESQNLIVYGHNMNSGAMFGHLDRFTASDYWRQHRYLYFQTLHGTSEYEIVSVMKADLSIFPFQQVDFAGEGSLKEYVRQAKGLGLFETRELCNVSAPVLTLVTCAYEWEEARTVLVAVRKAEVSDDLEAGTADKTINYEKDK